MRSRLLAALIAVGSLITAGAGAVTVAGAAASPSIHGCVNRSTGALRVATKCSASERAITWNALGKRGKPGIAGSDAKPAVALYAEHDAVSEAMSPSHPLVAKHFGVWSVSGSCFVTSTGNVDAELDLQQDATVSGSSNLQYSLSGSPNGSQALVQETGSFVIGSATPQYFLRQAVSTGFERIFDNIFVETANGSTVGELTLTLTPYAADSGNDCTLSGTARAAS